MLIGQVSITTSNQVLVCQKQTLTCKAESFEYKPPLVNSLFRLDFKKDLPKFEEYLITYDTCLADVFKQNKNDKLWWYVREYNTLILNILSERTANDLYDDDSIYQHQMDFNYYKQMISTILDDYFPLLSDISTDCKAEMDKMNETSHRSFRRAEQVLDILINLKKGHISKHLLPNNNITELLRLKDYMPTDNLKSIFIEEPFDIYDKQTARFTRSKIGRKSLLLYNPISYLTIFYTIFIPFEDKNYQNVRNYTVESTFTNSTATNSTVENSTLTDSVIVSSTLNYCTTTSTHITNCNVSGSTITSSNLRNCTVTDCTLTGCTLSNCIVRNCTITNCTIIKTLSFSVFLEHN